MNNPAAPSPANLAYHERRFRDALRRNGVRMPLCCTERCPEEDYIMWSFPGKNRFVAILDCRTLAFSWQERRWGLIRVAVDIEWCELDRAIQRYLNIYRIHK